MCVWLFSLPSWRNIDGDRCKRAETHTDDLKSNEVADTFHQLGPLQPAAIHADESKFLSQLLHNGLCERTQPAGRHRARRDECQIRKTKRAHDAPPFVDYRVTLCASLRR